MFQELPQDATDEVVFQHAWAHIFVVIGSLLNLELHHQHLHLHLPHSFSNIISLQCHHKCWKMLTKHNNMKIMLRAIHLNPLRLELDDKEEDLLVARGPIYNVYTIL